ncbi:MAG: DUF58 domain-containing protein [Spirochaetaceae bacterium]|nr:DUF58 domain-containing protein [Spirochaetaceae bacterium]
MLRKEPVLTLSAALFAACLVYCFLSVFLLALVHRKNAGTLRTYIVPEKTPVQGSVEIRLSQRIYFFELPAILIRYKLRLATKDGKTIENIFGNSFFKKVNAEFTVSRRGAYYGAHDELVIQDIFGFFRRPLKLYQGENERLIALPVPAETSPPALSVTGGTEGLGGAVFRKTDDFTEQRPYIPGDDPRRINWKLYAHAGELFIRQQDREPPPHSRFVLLIDTEADPSLYSAEEGAAAVDGLCGTALTLLLECAEHGGEALFGFTGGGITRMAGGAAELSTPLAYPARSALGGGQRLPGIPAFAAPAGALLFALARRKGTSNTCIQNFVEKNSGDVSIVFFYGTENQKNAAEGNAILFNRLPGIKAFAARITEQTANLTPVPNRR